MAFQCAACGRPLYNRRRKTCEFCGVPIPVGQQLSARQLAKIERMKADEAKQHRESMGQIENLPSGGGHGFDIGGTF